MQQFVRVVRELIIKQKIDTINISKTLLSTLPYKECDTNLFCSTLKKCGFFLNILQDHSNEPSNLILEKVDDQIHHKDSPKDQQLLITDKENNNENNFYMFITNNKTVFKQSNIRGDTSLDHSLSLEDLLFSITGREGIYIPDICIFGNKLIKRTSIFYENEYIYGFTNLKPASNGHVLLIPKRSVPFYSDMTINEQQAMAIAIGEVNSMLRTIYHTDSVTVSIQDGPLAGQTIKHIHCHMIPRVYDDFVPNDKIYDVLSLYDIEPQYIQDHFQPDSERTCRTNEEMKQEADLYKHYFDQKH